MTDHQVTLYGANGDVLPLGGEDATEGYRIPTGGMLGYYDAPVDTEWASSRMERGGRFKGMTQGVREMSISVRVTDREWLELDSRLAKAIPYKLDKWDPNAKLAQIGIDTDGDERRLAIQRSKDPEYAKDFDPIQALHLGEGIATFPVKVAQPMWESPAVVTVWETAGTSGTGTITISNPTDQVMFPTWVLTPGTWTVADVAWTGAEYQRTIRDARTIPLKPVTAAMGGLSIRCDPMKVAFVDQAGTNVMGQVAGDYYLVNFEIPPYTPATELPISVTGAPSGGARAELHQPRLWSRPWGLQ